MDSNVLKSDIKEFVATFNFYEGLRNKHFLITGSTGLIGSILIKCLIALNKAHGLNIQITCPVRDSLKAKKVFQDKDDELCCINYSIEETITHEAASQVDYVIHLAAPTASKYFIEHPVETFHQIVHGTEAVLEFCRRQSIKSMVYVSSLEVYGTIEDDNPLSEEAQGYINPLSTRSSYSLGKKASECLCHCYAKEYDIPVKVARLAQTFGAGVSETDNRVYAQLARWAAYGEDIVLHTDGQLARSYCYTTDAVSAILYILQSGTPGEAYNVANPDTYISIKDMAIFVKEHFAPNVQIKTILETGLGYAPSTKLHLDTQHLQSLGWQPRCNLHTMFERLIADIKTAHPKEHSSKITIK